MKGPIAAALAVLLAVAGCGGGADEGPVPSATPTGPTPPPGVELTEPGSTLELREPGTAVLDLSGGASSVVTVTVTKIKKGSMKDFRNFSLDPKSKKSRPYYVSAEIENQGPAGIGGVALPIVARTDDDQVYSASELVGRFTPCPTSTIPKSFLAGESAEVCMVYLIGPGEKLALIDLQPGDLADALHWKP